MDLVYYLGFKEINTQKLSGITSNDRNIYPNIVKIIKDTSNWKLIEKNYTHQIYEAFIEIRKHLTDLWC